MKSFFFSVVIPTYNQAELLNKAIESVLSQSFKNFEIIIIDNYSTDHTSEIIKKFEDNKVIHKKIRNEGIIAKSRNEGVKISKGDWIAFLDSDDWWYKERLQVIFEFIQNNNSFQVICTDELINDKITYKKKIWKYGPYTHNFYKHLLKSGNCISTSASAVSKKFLIKKNIFFNENNDFITAEDYEFFLRIALNDGKFKFLHRVLGEHLFHEKSQSSNYIKNKKAIISVVRYHIFEVQNFSKQKDKLWNSIKINFLYMDLIHFIKYKKNYFGIIFIILKMFFLSPIRSIFFIFLKIKKKILKN